MKKKILAAVLTACMLTSVAACGSSDTSGMPPESEMMLGFDAAANRSRTAEERIFTTRSAILSPVWSNVR